MGVIYILIPVAIILSAIGIYLFFWAVKTEQFDDLEKQGMSILFDDLDDKNNHEISELDKEILNKNEQVPSSTTPINNTHTDVKVEPK
jgi:cbb3-type cytochrome oxidase maturation protein